MEYIWQKLRKIRLSVYLTDSVQAFGLSVRTGYAPMEVILERISIENTQNSIAIPGYFLNQNVQNQPKAQLSPLSPLLGGDICWARVLAIAF